MIYFFINFIVNGYKNKIAPCLENDFEFDIAGIKVNILVIGNTVMLNNLKY